MGAILHEGAAKLTEFLTSDTTDDFQAFIQQTHQQQLQLKSELSKVEIVYWS